MAKNDCAADESVVAGIDVGGTFTDLIPIGRPNAKVRIAKTLTTPVTHAFGMIAALIEASYPIGDIDLIVHGSTTTTNAMLHAAQA